MMELVKAKTRYLTVTETAKLIRLTLKKRYPNIVFSVTSKKYSGGASIDVSWTDGARAKEIDAIVKGFEGSSFDGMNDLKSYQDCWLLPDGTAQLAYRPDSCGGSIPEYVSDAPHPNAELVSFGANFVFTNRHVSDFDNREIKALEYIRSHCTCEGIPPNDKFGEWVTSLARRMAQDFAEGETTAQTFERVVINRT
jgi:hypothetical protein